MAGTCKSDTPWDQKHWFGQGYDVLRIALHFQRPSKHPSPAAALLPQLRHPTNPWESRPFANTWHTKELVMHTHNLWLFETYIVASGPYRFAAFLAIFDPPLLHRPTNCIPKRTLAPNNMFFLLMVKPSAKHVGTNSETPAKHLRDSHPWLARPPSWQHLWLSWWPSDLRTSHQIK